MDWNGSILTRALLDPLYEAATQPEMGQVFLQKAAETLRADTAAFMVHDPKNGETAVRIELGFTHEMRRDTEELIKFSPWKTEILKHLPKGWYSGTPDDVIPLETFRKSMFYNELWRKHNVETVCTAVVFGPEGTMPGLGVSRSRSEPPFSEEDKELMRQLVPHLDRVFKVFRAVNVLRISNAAGQYALDLIGAACLTIDSAGKVLSMNRRAEILIANGSTLRIRGRRLVTAVTPEQGALDACVLQACACGEGKSFDPGDGAVVLHSAQGTALYLSALPYHSGWSILEGRPAALVFITTPEEQGHGEHRLWQSMFGLSPAECRVAEMMKQGMDVAEISESIKIKMDTVRYYQKCIYRKAGVRGQGQLMRLLTRMPSSKP